MVENVSNDTYEYDGDIHEEAISRFNNEYRYLQEERSWALADRRFVFIPGAQWEGDWGELFTNAVKIEVNKTAQGLTDIINAFTDHRIAVNYRAVGASTKDDAASTLNGMYLADYSLSGGDQAELNAFLEGVAGGYGAWRLTNVYCDDEDEEDTSQKIIWETIVDADQNVFWDRNSRLYDKSDAKHCYVITPYSPEAFAAEFGDDKLSNWPQTFTKPYYDWYAPQVIYVAEYYKLVEKSDTVYQFMHKITQTKDKVYKSDKDQLAKRKDLLTRGYELTYTKKITKTECRKWILSGLENLTPEGEEGKLIAGGVIPVVPFYGQRFFIDNQERAKGHVRLAKDPQRVYNIQVSKLTEIAALAPREIPIFYAEQITGHEESWKNQNLERHPYALINPIVDESTGQKIPAGPVSSVKPPDMPPVMAALIQMSASDIQELTNSQDGAGEVKANVSADAMDIAATRTDAKADIYISNMARSVTRAGQIYKQMARDIYFETDRVVSTAAYDDKQKLKYGTASINSRVTDDEGNQVIKNQLDKSAFNVIADVTEQTKTRRDKTVKSLYNMLQFIMPSDPQLGSAVANTMILNMDGDGIEDLQMYVRQEMLLAGIIQPNEDEAKKLAALKEEQANKPPSTQDQVLQAEATNLIAGAEEHKAKAAESASKVLVNQANTAKLHSETGANHVETIRSIHTPIEKPEQIQAPEHRSAPQVTKTKPTLLQRFRNLGKQQF